MFCFLSRRVSVAAICMWSAVVMLCTMPGAVQAMPMPFENRMARMVSFLKRECNAYCHFLNPAANPSDPNSVAAAGTDPIANPITPDTSSAPPAEPTSDTAATPVIQKTSGAPKMTVNFNPLLVWAAAGTGGAILAVF